LKTRMKRIPIALTVAGSDSGGGAGLQADLKTFAILGVHGTTVLSCLTAQNPVSVAAFHSIPVSFVRAQLETVFAELPPVAAKTGMLYSAAIIRAVADWFSQHPEVKLVIDPVMIATSGTVLLRPTALRVLQDRFLPLAAVVTPNLDEAAALLGRPLRSVEDLSLAARGIHGRWGVPTLIKGGHLRDTPLATDVFWDGRQERILAAPFIRGVATHGTGCTYSAAITACLAHGDSLLQAVSTAKLHITGAIRSSLRIANHTTLNPSYDLDSVIASRGR
jgi:hydroxymethylpyrimidine/phosphomethylpyrimidine kinase